MVHPLEIYKNMLRDKPTQTIKYFSESDIEERGASYPSREKYMNRIMEIGGKLRLSKVSIHLGLKLFDIAIHRTKLCKELLAFTCLLMGAKFHEEDSNLPFARDLLKHSSFNFSTAQQVKCEKQVCELIDWNLLL